MRYTVFWKGKKVGEFTHAEIQDKLRRGEIGLMHTIFWGTSEVSAKEFLTSQESFETVEESTSEDFSGFDFETFAYVLAGLSFLSVAFLLVGFVYAIFLAKSGQGKIAKFCVGFSCASAVAGYLVFKVLLGTWGLGAYL